MKALSNIRYVLFAISVIGLFATFAQNEYGFTIINICDFFIALISFAFVIVYARKVWKDRKSASILLLVFALYFFLLPFVAGRLTSDIFNWVAFISGPLLILSGTIWVIVDNRKKERTTDLFIGVESLIVFCVFGGYWLRSLHWPGGPFLIVGSTFIAILFYIPAAIRVLRRNLKKGKGLALFSFLFYFTMFCNATGYAFKMQHYPFGTIIIWVGCILLAILLIPLLIRFKFPYDTDKITLGGFINKTMGSSVFLFIFLGYFSVYMLLSGFRIVPNVSSIARPPAYDKMLDERVADETSNAYINNWNDFLSYRYQAEQEKKQ